MAFEDLEGRRLHNLSGNPVPELGYLHTKEVFPDVQPQPLVFQFEPIPSCPVTGHH